MADSGMLSDTPIPDDEPHFPDPALALPQGMRTSGKEFGKDFGKDFGRDSGKDSGKDSGGEF